MSAKPNVIYFHADNLGYGGSAAMAAVSGAVRIQSTSIISHGVEV